jgi:anti-repressor protein
MEEPMNAIVPFNFGDQPIRIEDRGGSPWFVLADVCRVLGLSNVGDAAARVRASERDDIALTDAIGRDVQAIAVNEAGLYRLIMRSRKPAAERFSDWVVGEVLPSIRRTGSYGAPAHTLDLTDAATLQRLLLGMTGKTMAIEERIAELEPQAAALDRLTDAHGAMAVTHAAKAMGVKPGKLFDWLEANDWMYRGADGLIGYQVKVDQGLIEHKVHRHDRGPQKPAKLINRALLTPKGIARLTALGAGR